VLYQTFRSVSSSQHEGGGAEGNHAQMMENSFRIPQREVRCNVEKERTIVDVVHGGHIGTLRKFMRLGRLRQKTL
jgi:hypothetical protein